MNLTEVLQTLSDSGKIKVVYNGYPQSIIKFSDTICGFAEYFYGQSISALCNLYTPGELKVYLKRLISIKNYSFERC